MKRHFLIGLILLLAASWLHAEVQEYALQPGDVLSIMVVEHPEFSGRHKIRPDGRINYPVVGEVDVAALTCAQLVKVMQGKLSSYVNNPVVSVSIEAYYANKIYVIGDVRNSGEFEIYEPLDLIKVMAMCGGLRSPKTKLVKIIRADGTVVDVNVKEIFGTGAKQKYLLYPGDTLFVPSSLEIPWGMLATILSLLSVGLSVVISVNSLASK